MLDSDALSNAIEILEKLYKSEHQKVFEAIEFLLIVTACRHFNGNKSTA